MSRTIVNRKDTHLDLYVSAQSASILSDHRFNYEPLFSVHPGKTPVPTPVKFLNKMVNAPLWISALTGGSSKAIDINHNLALVAKKWRLPLSLGSCRVLLDSGENHPSLNLRKLLGKDGVLIANLGIAQIEQSLACNDLEKIIGMMKRLDADALMIHINPLQEFFQPDGDRILVSPIETIKKFISLFPYPLMVKEVGQGMGPKSLLSLMKLPLALIEFGAFGGANFSILEMLRNKEQHPSMLAMANVGHTPIEMIQNINKILTSAKGIKCRSFVVSGGIDSALTGMALMKQLDQKRTDILFYGYASKFLDYAKVSFDSVDTFVEKELRCIDLVRNYLEFKQ